MEATQAGHLERHLCVTLRFFLVMAGCTRPVQRDLRFIKIVFEDMDCRNTHVSPETPGAETCVVSGLILRLCCWGPISKSAPNQLSLTSLRLCSLVSEWDTSAARSSELRFVVGAGVLFGCRAHAESARYCLIGGRSSGRPPRARTWRGGMGPSCRAGCGTWSCQDWDKSWATSLGLLFVHAARRFFLLVNLSSAVVAVPTPFFHRGFAKHRISKSFPCLLCRGLSPASASETLFAPTHISHAVVCRQSFSLWQYAHPRVRRGEDPRCHDRRAAAAPGKPAAPRPVLRRRDRGAAVCGAGRGEEGHEKWNTGRSGFGWILKKGFGSCEVQGGLGTWG